MCIRKKGKVEAEWKGRVKQGRSEAGGTQNKALSEDDEERIIGTKCGGRWVRVRGTLPDRSMQWFCTITELRERVKGAEPVGRNAASKEQYEKKGNRCPSIFLRGWTLPLTSKKPKKEIRGFAWWSQMVGVWGKERSKKGRKEAMLDINSCVCYLIE